MKIDFPFIEIEGLRSFVRKTRIDLSRAGNGLHFIKGYNRYQERLGSNGAGKSTIWAALTWCLYGKTLSGLTRPDLKPWYGDSETQVSVGVANDGRMHTITRRSGRISIDGKTAGQEQIDKLLGYMPLDVFGHTILFAQGKPLFFDLEPSAKMKLFTTMLQLDRWDRRSELASQSAKKIAVGDLPALAARLQAMETEFSHIDEQMQRLQDDSDLWEEEHRANVDEWESQLADLRKQLSGVVKRWGVADLALEQAGMELQPQQKLVDKLNNDLRELESFHNGLVISVKNDIRRLENEIDALGDGNNCPVCGQSVKGSALQRHHRDLKRQIDEKRSKLINDRSREKIDALRAKLDKQIRIRDKFAASVEDAHTALDRLGPQKAELETKINSIKARLDESAETHNPYFEQLSGLKRRKRELIKAIDAVKQDEQQLRQKHDQSKWWVKGFKEVKLYQMEEVLQELELASNNMLDDNGLDGWEIHYEVERENKSGTMRRGLHVMILSPDNDEAVKWEVWSGGEGQRLRIIGALALGEVLLNHAGIECGMTVLDEPTQHLSTEGIDDLCEFLSDRAYQLKQQIWFADQNVVEGDYFNRTLTVLKDKNGSRIGGL